MASKFGCAWSDHTTSTARTTPFSIVPAAAKPVEIIEFSMTGSGITTAADTQHECALNSRTNGGAAAGAATTPSPFQFTSAASAGTTITKCTTEPTTYTTVPHVFFGFNQRGGMRWAVPRLEGLLVSQADTQLAAGITVISVAAGKVSGSVNWWENV